MMGIFLSRCKKTKTASLVMAGLLFCAAFSPVASYAQSAFEDPQEVGVVSVPDLVASSSQIDGGILPIGGSAQIVVLFQNKGSEPVMVGDVNLYPSSSVTAQVGMNQCSSAPLPAGAECAITLSVSALQAGAWRVETLVSHNGRSRLAMATVTGNVDRGAEGDNNSPTDVSPRPEDVEFGTIGGRTPLVRSVILTNTTSAAIQIEDIILDASSQSGFVLDHNCSVLDPGQGCIAKVRWTPKNEGPAQGVLVIQHDGPSRVVQVNIAGTYNPTDIDEPNIWPEASPGKGLLVSSRTDVDFGSDVDGAAAITTSLINVGEEDIVIDLIRLAGSDNGLSLARDGCRMGVVLSPTEACALTVNWLPRREGPIIDDIQILHSGARGVLILPVRGEAEKPISASSKQTITKERDGEVIEVVASTPTMDGYTVTSHSQTKAIISGPTGSRVVRDGEVLVMEGLEWIAKIVPSGVELIGEFDRILLVFDSALGPQSVRTPALGNPPSDTTSTGSDD